LLAIARAAIAREFGIETIVDQSAAWLREPGACFVTLMQHGELRGCIGSLETRRAVLDDVKANAHAAAFADPRFAPLQREELRDLDIEVSLLSPLQPLIFSSEADALAQLQPNIDGVVFEYGFHRGTFLPQVWEQLPTPCEFLKHLKVKSGVPVNFWSDAIKLYRYSVRKWKERDFQSQTDQAISN
jgi:AmmeMemoRadiSam system protein A